MELTCSALALLHGNADYPNLNGVAKFYTGSGRGTYLQVEVWGLPDTDSFFGMHIHEYGDCSLPFQKTGSHYNPGQMLHPFHAGDLPPLLGNHGYAYACCYTDRFQAADVIGRSLVIHANRDDLTTQPAGDSGEKIACGVIASCRQ